MTLALGTWTRTLIKIQATQASSSQNVTRPRIFWPEHTSTSESDSRSEQTLVSDQQGYKDPPDTEAASRFLAGDRGPVWERRLPEATQCGPRYTDQDCGQARAPGSRAPLGSPTHAMTASSN